MRTRKALVSLAVVAFLGLLTYGLIAEGSSGPQVGEAAPVNELDRLDGSGTATLDQYRGQWVLVNFWASWCAPCREEAPDLQELQETYAGEDFTVLGIATRDLSHDGMSFVNEFGLTYPQLRDGDGSEAQDWGTTGVPENFLVDPDGIVRETYRGPIDLAAIRDTFLPHVEADRRRADDQGDRLEAS